MPNSKDLSGSVYETLTAHGETLIEYGEKFDSHGQILKQHAIEISVLKKSDEDIMRELKGMKTDFTNLENTIWKTAQSTQDMMTSQNAQQWKLIEALNSGKERDKERKHEIQKTKLEKFWEWAGKVTVSGGILVVALELIFGK